MHEVGIRALKQNASEVVARVAAGEVITVTDRGRPVAQLVPVSDSKLDGLVVAGLARPPKRPLAELPTPVDAGVRLSDAILAERDDEQY